MIDDKQRDKTGSVTADYYTLQYKRRSTQSSAEMRQSSRANDKPAQNMGGGSTGLVGVGAGLRMDGMGGGMMGGGASSFQCNKPGTSAGSITSNYGGNTSGGGSIMVDSKLSTMCSDVPLLSDIPVPSQFKDQSSQKNIKHHIPDSIPI